MYGERKQQATINCTVCGKPQRFLVDLEDVARAIAERPQMIHETVVDREGKSYLTPAEAELLISGTCDECWKLLCPSDELAYS